MCYRKNIAKPLSTKQKAVIAMNLQVQSLHSLLRSLNPRKRHHKKFLNKRKIVSNVPRNLSINRLGLIKAEGTYLKT